MSEVAEVSPEAFLKEVLTPLLDHPEVFRVEVKGEGRKRDVLIHADQRDRGRIIGKSGRMISSLRTVLKTAGEKAGLVINLEIYEDEASKPSRRAEREEAS